MSDLISRQAAIDALTTYIYNVYKVVVGKTLPAEDCGDAAESVIDELPTLEIIHCKDCKFYGRADKRRFYRGSDCLNKRIDTIVPDRDFCSKAEKRGETDE